MPSAYFRFRASQAGRFSLSDLSFAGKRLRVYIQENEGLPRAGHICLPPSRRASVSTFARTLGSAPNDGCLSLLSAEAAGRAGKAGTANCCDSYCTSLKSVREHPKGQKSR